MKKPKTTISRISSLLQSRTTFQVRGYSQYNAICKLKLLLKIDIYELQKAPLSPILLANYLPTPNSHYKDYRLPQKFLKYDFKNKIPFSSFENLRHKNNFESWPGKLKIHSISTFQGAKRDSKLTQAHDVTLELHWTTLRGAVYPQFKTFSLSRYGNTGYRQYRFCRKFNLFKLLLLIIVYYYSAVY